MMMVWTIFEAGGTIGRRRAPSWCRGAGRRGAVLCSPGSLVTPPCCLTAAAPGPFTLLPVCVDDVGGSSLKCPGGFTGRRSSICCLGGRSGAAGRCAVRMAAAARACGCCGVWRLLLLCCGVLLRAACKRLAAEGRNGDIYRERDREIER